jgi:hypothetical protein
MDKLEWTRCLEQQWQWHALLKMWEVKMETDLIQPDSRRALQGCGFQSSDLLMGAAIYLHQKAFNRKPSIIFDGFKYHGSGIEDTLMYLE